MDGSEAVEAMGKEIANLLNEFRRLLQELQANTSSSSPERRQTLAAIHRVVQQVRTTKEAYQLELRGVPPENRGLLKEKLHVLLSDFQSLMTEYEWQRSQLTREALTAPNPDGPDATMLDPSYLDNRQQLVQYGDQVQDKTQDSLHRIRNMVDDTEKMGGQIVERLDEQTEQMTKIHEQMNDIEYNLQRAKKTMKSIARNAASDRCVQLLCCLVFVFLIASICVLVIPGRIERQK
eukprot:GHVT01054153.1.p1 GENE.GHVT01054153.1~~GHVT01054153.1.p1  ORF type:complete len:235 (-),score=23.50 GHVT01054153.1:5714-6418(-)